MRRSPAPRSPLRSILAGAAPLAVLVCLVLLWGAPAVQPALAKDQGPGGPPPQANKDTHGGGPPAHSNAGGNGGGPGSAPGRRALPLALPSFPARG